MKDLTAGFRCMFAGVRLLNRPGVRRYVVIPLLINTLLFTLVITLGASQLNDLIQRLSASWSWVEYLSWLLWPLFVLLSLTIVFFCFTFVANLVAAPFNGFLAQAVEENLLGKSRRAAGGWAQLPAELIKAVESELRKFLYFLVRALPLLLLFVIPLVQAVAPLAWFLFGAWMLALEYLDYPMGNHELLFPDIRRRLEARPRLALGFGAGVLIFTMIPVLNFIAVPTAVAAATLLYTEHLSGSAAADEEPGVPAHR